MPMEKNLKIGIVGLGLIGGSILKALSKEGFELYAVSRSLDTIAKAKDYSKNVSNSLDILSQCDIVFVCTPMNKTLKILDELETILDKSTIVTDVCSLKRFVTLKKRPYKFIPSHPMAGTEHNGFINSFESLFIGAKWVLTPFQELSVIDTNKLVKIINILGAKEIFSTPSEHDEAVALISHMPMVISQALFKTANNNDLALKLASSGFRDMTRLALSNEEMAQDMLNYNADNIQTSILSLYSSVGELLKEDYKNQISEIKRYRQEMYQDGNNIL